MSPVRSCLFCRKRPTTQEHAWPRWYLKFLQERLPGQKTHVFRGPVGAMQRFVSKEGLTTGHFCKPCNTVWMSGIENATKHLVLELGTVRKSPVNLSAKNQAALAKWAYLRVLALDPVHRSELAPIPRKAYEDFYETEIPPDNVAIWTNAFWGKTEMGSSFRSTVEKSEPTGATRFFLTTFTILRLSFQVCGPLTFGGQLPKRGIEPKAIFRAQRIWPPRKGPISWPPGRKAIDGDVLDLFATRDFG